MSTKRYRYIRLYNYRMMLDSISDFQLETLSDLRSAGCYEAIRVCMDDYPLAYQTLPSGKKVISGVKSKMSLINSRFDIVVLLNGEWCVKNSLITMLNDNPGMDASSCLIEMGYYRVKGLGYLTQKEYEKWFNSIGKHDLYVDTVKQIIDYFRIVRKCPFAISRPNSAQIEEVVKHMNSSNFEECYEVCKRVFGMKKGLTAWPNLF